MKTAAVLTVFVLGKTSQAFVAPPITISTTPGQASAGALPRSSVGGAGAEHRYGYGWAGVARRRSSGGVCTATSSELDQSAE